MPIAIGLFLAHRWDGASWRLHDRARDGADHRGRH
jgi:hypothetical protein